MHEKSIYKRLLHPASLYRCAALLFVLFALGHTVGFLTFRPGSAEAQEVYARMSSVQFAMGHNLYTYGNFYRGFGLTISASQLFFAYLSYALARMARDAAAIPVGLPWVFASIQLTGLVLSIAYFGAPPIILHSLLILVLGAAAAGVGRARHGRS
jgi:hypothetical protein